MRFDWLSHGDVLPLLLLGRLQASVLMNLAICYRGRAI